MRTVKTSPIATLNGSAAEQLRALTLRADAAKADPDRDSRWPWKHRRALDRYWDSESNARWAAQQLREQLIGETASRIAVSNPAQEPWQLPDAQLVLGEVASVSRHVTVSYDQVVNQIYHDKILALNSDDLRLVEHHAAHLSLTVLRFVCENRCFITRPHEHGPQLTVRDSLQTVLTSEDAELPRPIVVWRGEHPNPRDPDFGEAVRTAKPGDIISRYPTPLSVSLDPEVASLSEFTHVLGSRGPRRSADGWLLEISTRKLIYVGTRDKLLNITDGLADDEKEGLIFAPNLRVTSHWEGLAQGRWGPKRIHVVKCAAL